MARVLYSDRSLWLSLVIKHDHSRHRNYQDLFVPHPTPSILHHIITFTIMDLLLTTCRLMYYAAALGFFRNTSNVTIRAALSKLASHPSTKEPKTIDRRAYSNHKSCSGSSISDDIIWWSRTKPSDAPYPPISGTKNVSPGKQTTGSLFSLLAFIEAIVPLASSPMVAWLYTTSLSW